MSDYSGAGRGTRCETSAMVLIFEVAQTSTPTVMKKSGGWAFDVQRSIFNVHLHNNISK